MKAVITVLGKDMVGILAKVSTKCAHSNANVIEVSQSVMQELFAMIMLVDISQMNCGISELTKDLDSLGQELGLKIHVMHQDIFDSMHRI